MGASRVEQFEQIRRDRAQEGLSIRKLARRHGVHRRAVRQALKSAVPPPKRAPESRPAPKLGPYRTTIDEWLKADQEAARQMVDVLMLCRELGARKVELAVRGALAAGAHDGRAVALLARRSERPAAPVLQLEERLVGVGSPPPQDLSGYDRLREVA